jgi:hypothetical protein
MLEPTKEAPAGSPAELSAAVKRTGLQENPQSQRGVSRQRSGLIPLAQICAN